METREFSTLSSSQPDQASNVVKQMQPVPTSGGRDLAQDLVWQRDPDCSKDPAAGNSVLVSPGQLINQSSVSFPVSTGAAVQSQLSTPYSYQVPPTEAAPTPSGDNIQVPGGVVPTFQQPNAYSGIRPQNVVQYVSVTNTQHVVMDTDGNRIQQNPIMHQNMPFAGYPMQQNMVPVQFNTNNSLQYVNMQPPATVNPQLNYQRQIAPYNPQTMSLQTPQAGSTQFTPPRPANLNVTVASQLVQHPGNLSTATTGTQMTSPMMAGATGQSPTGIVSPGTESVKSPTYVYMCNKCNYVTPYRSSFKTHYSSHIQYKPFQCAYCIHQTIMKQPMQKHVKLKHAIEDSEGFTYESDSKKENIIEFFCNQCRSTMNMEEAKTYLAKFEGSHEKLKPGPAKRKISKYFSNDDKEEEPVSPSKKKKRFSLSENQNEEDDQNIGSKMTKSPISPRKLTHWKQDVPEISNMKRKVGRPYKDGDVNVKRKTFIGKQNKFKGFGKQKKYLPQTFGAKNFLCSYCEFRSASYRGLKKHCEWRHREKGIKCTNCSFSTYFEEELKTHISNNECENENAQPPTRHERSKSPEKAAGKQKTKIEESKNSDALSEEASDDSNDDIQLNCPHCNFVSHPFALKRHLFFYHKECDWRCKLCSFISNSKKEVVRHSNKAHPDSQPNIVQTFADISSLLPDDVLEQDKSTPPEKDISENDKVISKHRLIDRDYIKTSKKRLVLGKKRVSKIVGSGESGTEDQLQVTKVSGMEKKGINLKRGRKREEKEVHDQSSFIVRPKKLKIATIGFSCVYCTYAAPLRHQLRLHCYEKHTKHPACLMEFVNCETALLEEQINFARDMTEEKKSVDIETDSSSKVGKEPNGEEKTGDKKSCNQSVMESFAAEDNKGQSNECPKMEIEATDNTENKTQDHDQTNIDFNDVEKKNKSESKNPQENKGMTPKDEEEQKKDVLSCMENILADITQEEKSCMSDKNCNDDSKSVNCILPDKMNGHKFSNPFSTLIVQLNSTEIKVKDAFEGTLDDVDIYLEKMGVRTLNMDSLTPKQFDIFMRKFGSSLQPLTL